MFPQSSKLDEMQPKNAIKALVLKTFHVEPGQSRHFSHRKLETPKSAMPCQAAEVNVKKCSIGTFHQHLGSQGDLGMEKRHGIHDLCPEELGVPGGVEWIRDGFSVSSRKEKRNMWR